MVLEIRLSNFFSIKDEVVLDLRAGSIKTKQAEELKDNVFKAGSETLLKTVALYGANASGKSNILQAITACRHLVIWSHSFNENTDFPFKPFKFDGFSDKPSEFYMRFIANEIEYEYGFTLTQKEILREELWHYPKGKKAKVFIRDEQISHDKSEIYSFGQSTIRRPMDVAENTSRKTLYVSRGSQMDREILQVIYRFFGDSILIGDSEFIINMRKVNPEEIIKALGIADSDIAGIVIEFKDIPQSNLRDTSDPEDGIRAQMVFTSIHKKDPTIQFDFFREESQGTQTMFFHLITALYAVKSNKIVFLDEIERSLHPKIVEYLISLFHASESAQLVFTTHNTHLLDLRKYRKDQIYFVNKKEDSSTDLYSLFDYKDFRETMDLEKAYLQGRFDAVPIVDDSPARLKELVE